MLKTRLKSLNFKYLNNYFEFLKYWKYIEIVEKILIKMAEKKGFEPSLGYLLLLVFETNPFSHLGTSPLNII